MYSPDRVCVRRSTSRQGCIPTIHEPGTNIRQQLSTEKAYLHFDNTSYYVGDTIWFKAYVTLAEKQTFSLISRPLYVELVDQTGHIADKQIIKLTQGEGNGQFILPHSMLSGYYEVRAYTRWMLAFNEPQYFSRTFPIYQLSNSDKLERSITTYELSSSMENRPSETEEKLNVRFSPKGTISGG